MDSKVIVVLVVAGVLAAGAKNTARGVKKLGSVTKHAVVKVVNHQK